MNRLKFLAALAVLLAFSSGAVVGMLGRDIRRDVLIPAPGQSSLAEELSLTPEQSADLRAIWSDAIAEAGPPPIDRVDAAEREREQAVAALLTPEQQARYRQIREDFDAKMRRLHGGTEAAFRRAEERTRSILDPGQRARYDELLKRAPGDAIAVPFIGGAASAPATQPIRLFRMRVGAPPEEKSQQRGQ
jgi:hypothetical protein